MPTLRKNILVLGLTLITAASIHAGRGLVDHSPFLPPDFDPGRSNAPSASDRPSTPIERQIEFKGWYEINGEVRVLLSQRQNNGGGWMRIGESRDAITLLDFDPSQEQVRVRYENSEGWLSMAQLESNPSGNGSSTRERRATGSRPSSERSTSTRTVRSSDDRPTTALSPRPQRRSVSSPGGTSRTQRTEPPAGAPRYLPGSPSRASDSGSSEGGGSTATGAPGDSADQRPSGTPPTTAPTTRPDTEALRDIALPSRRR